MPYLVYDADGTVRSCRIRKQQEAELAVKVHHPGGGYKYYSEPEEADNYWYPQEAKTPLQEFHLGNYKNKIAIGETLELNGLPEGTKIKLKLVPIGEVGSVGTMRWTPKAKGVYQFTFSKLGYKQKKITIVVGLAPVFRKAFDLELI